MALHLETKQFLQFLQGHRDLRAQIRAPMNATLLYAGSTAQNNPWKADTPVYRKIQAMRLTNPALATKQMLSDVIARLPAPGTGHPTLLTYAGHVDDVLQRDGVSEREQIIIWRALSGIFASNAMGAVSFIIGDGVGVSTLKVFALTEIHVLERNVQIDAVTRDMVAYLKRCVQTHTCDISVALIRND